MQKELSKRIRELAIVGECLIPLQLVWIVLFLHPSMIIPLIFKILVLCIALYIDLRKIKKLKNEK